MKQKKLEKLFDLICHTVEHPNDDMDFMGHSLNPLQQRVVAGQQIQAFMMEGGVVAGNKLIQAFGVTSDLPKIETNVWNASQEVPNFDTNWARTFRTVPLRKGQLEWTIGKVQSGTTYKILEEGDKVDFYGMSGEVIKASIELYGAGLSLTWKIIEGRDLAAFYDMLMDFRSKRQELYANTHYGLMATAGATNPVPWQGAAEDSQVQRDVLTINKARSDMAEKLKDKGYGDMANATFLLYYHDSLRERITAALRVTTADLTRGAQAGVAVYQNIVPISTLNSNIPVGKAEMVLPGQKAQNSMYLQERVFERTDGDSMNYLKSSFTAFGAIIGDNEQFSELSFS